MDEETRIIKLKYAAPQICMMTSGQLKTWSKALLLKINIITSWIIPEGEYLNVLTDQFEKKLREDYDMLNTEEIEYAFRKSGTLIKDWGKEMNLNLIDQVLAPYVSERREASEAEEKRRSVPPVQKIWTDEEILNERRGHIEAAFQAIRKGYLPILFNYFHEVLLNDGLLMDKGEEIVGALRQVIKESVVEFFVRKVNSGAENIYVNE